MKCLYRSIFRFSAFNTDIYPVILHLSGNYRKYKSIFEKRIISLLIKQFYYTEIRCYQFQRNPWNANMNKSKMLRDLFRYYIKFMLICSIYNTVYIPFIKMTNIELFYNYSKHVFKSVESEQGYYIDKLYLIFTKQYDYDYNNIDYTNIYDCFSEECVESFTKTECLKEFYIRLL